MLNTEQMDIATRLLNDDESALEELLRTFGPNIMALMKQRYWGVLGEADIEDILSIALFRLWTARRRFDSSRGSIQVWFFRIVENAARDVLRLGWQKARQLETQDDFELLQSTASTINGRSKNIARRSSSGSSQPTQLTLDLREIVEHLPEVQRTIITADSIARDDVANSHWLAAELSMKPATVRVYRKRAMDRVRKELKERGHDVQE